MRYPPVTKERTAIPPARTTWSGVGNAWGLLQRKCACGGTGGVCEECGKKSGSLLQRRAYASQPEQVPPIVYEVLDSPGIPLESRTCADMEPRFAHDFSQVRVHFDDKAERSAEALNALAYTAGSNIVFGRAQYQPSSEAGRRLLAHELTHVVQQSEPDKTSSVSETVLESQARAVEQGINHDRIPAVVSRSGSAQILRQPAPVQAAAQPPRMPSQSEQDIINAARMGGFVRCQLAFERTVGLVPPGPPKGVDPAQAWASRARSLAQIMFEWDDPNMDQVGEIVGSMRGFLTPGLQVRVADPSDPDCGNRDGYVRGLRQPIVLCPHFFRAGSEQQIRTMIHEAAHLARVASSDLSESYCVDLDCVTSCGGFSSADSWLHYVHCLSGRPPDQPIVIQGNPGGTRPTP